MIEIIFALHILISFIMFGSVWFVQMVDYPLFRFVGKKSLGNYEKERIRRVLSVAFILMIIETITATILIFTPQIIPTTFAIINLALMIPIWIITCKVEVPVHRALTKGYKQKEEDKILRGNKYRVLFYTLRIIILFLVLTR